MEKKLDTERTDVCLWKKEEDFCPMTEKARIYDLAEIETTIDGSKTFCEDVVQAVLEAFIAYSGGQFHAAPVATLGAPPGPPFSKNCENYDTQVCVKSGYIADSEMFVIKVAGGGHPVPNTGNVQVYSQKTCRLLSLFMDEGILTEHRTAAAGALALRHLGPDSIETIGLLGTGVQARYQLQYCKLATNCRKVLIYGRTKGKLDALVEELQDAGVWSVETTDDPNDLLKTCDVVVTTTSARTPLITEPAVAKRPQLIICIGADAPGKSELDPHVLANADILVADSLVQTKERGEFQKAIQSGLVQMDSVFELGSMLKSCSASQKQPCVGRTVFDSSGISAQDVAIAALTLRLLTEKETSL